ncbi:MAG: serine/threonine protein kinase [Cyanobacteria bacterium P01_D01_bin.116]
MLVYLHRRQPPLIHRDIKPSNIILAERPYLVDFGSVQTLANKGGKTFTVVGTYGYMPPEQFGGAASAASDLYSLGATLIFLVTGLHPTELPQKDLQIQFRQTANFSEEFADWLEWMTEPSLNQRYKFTEEAVKALDNPVSRKNKYLSKEKLDKPISSEIKLNKNIDNSEIIIPPQGFRIVQIALIALASPFALGIYLSKLTIANKLPQRNILLDHYFQIFGISFILFIVIWSLFKTTRLQINKNRFVLIYELLGTKTQWFSKKMTQPISQLELTKIIGSSGTFVNHKLFMETNSQKFCLSRYANFTPEELEWLAQEISDYLDVPIERI